MRSSASPGARLQGGSRALALEIAAEARAEWGFASDIIARSFRAHRELPSGDRRKISETVYGLIRMDRRLDAILEELRGQRRADAAVGPAAFADLSPVARDALKLVIHELREGLPPEAARDEAKRWLGAEVDLARVVDEDAGLGKRTGLEREAVRLSVPTWMLEQFTNDYGPERGAALADAMNRRAPMALRVNTARISRDALVARLAEEHVVAKPTPLAPAGLVLETRVNAFGLSAFQEGLFEVMDEGSQLVAEVVAPPPGGRVVDACAGAGGKTLAIGASMANKGRLLALDTDGKKLEELRRRARRAGLTNVAARAVEGEGAASLPAEAKRGAWDRVLVDAPCSGLGTLRRNPEARWRLTPAAVKSFPARQLALLVTYAPLVAEGGRLIYATCSVVEDENEGVVSRFLAERDDFVRVPVKEIWGKERAAAVGDELSLRLLPNVHDTDGFFAAVLRRVR
ncbi:MAG TPA: RsmB/NOP family class I SAM-dependent RNA methyltransferase [Polyangia bacterium]|nr:RsmB/NOP family class I SAM-dependent RNA methyltransferase [Polyangia bacterium]